MGDLLDLVGGPKAIIGLLLPLLAIAARRLAALAARYRILGFSAGRLDVVLTASEPRDDPDVGFAGPPRERAPCRRSARWCGRSAATTGSCRSRCTSRPAWRTASATACGSGTRPSTATRCARPTACPPRTWGCC